MSEKPKGVYVPIDVLITDDEDIAQVGMAGFGLYVSGLCYAKRNRTDGFIPKAIVERLLVSPSLDDLAECHAVVTRLCETGLWFDTGTGYQIRSWDQWNPTDGDREKWAERKRKQRESHADVTDSVAVTVMSRESHAPVTPMSRGEVEEKRREEKRTKTLAPSRKSDPVWDVLVECFGAPTDTARGAMNAAAKTLRDFGADPEEIAGFFNALHGTKNAWAVVTATATAKHFGSRDSLVDEVRTNGKSAVSRHLARAEGRPS